MPIWPPVQEEDTLRDLALRQLLVLPRGAVTKNSVADNFLQRTTFFGATGNAFTCMAWVLSNSLPASSEYRNLGGMSGAITMQFFNSGAGARFSIGTSANDFNGTATPVAGRWYHMALVRNGNSKTLYVDGAQEASGSDTATGSTTLILGDYNSAQPSDGWYGRLYDARIWDGLAMSADEVRREMRSLVPYRWRNLRGWYPLTHPSMMRQDFGPFKQHLTLTGTITATEPGPPHTFATRLRRRRWAFVAPAAGGGGRIWKLAGRGGGLSGPTRGLAAKPCI